MLRACNRYHVAILNAYIYTADETNNIWMSVCADGDFEKRRMWIKINRTKDETHITNNDETFSCLFLFV